jgi:hypothetical protein
MPLLRGVWTDTIGVEVRSEPPKRGADLFDSKIVTRPVEIPNKVLERALDAATGRPGGKLRRDVLAYHLVGHRWDFPWRAAASKVKHLIETSRDLDK